MSTPTHMLFGFTLATLATKTGLAPESYHYIYPVCMLAANAPDFDIFLVRMKKNHRFSKLHFPMLWAAGLGCADLIVRATGNSHLLPYLLLVAIAALSHFILDTFDAYTGILWFAPVYKKAYCFLRRSTAIPITIKDHVRSYIRHPVMIAETAVWLICLYVVLK